MHTTVDLKVLYFGTPVVLISTRNEDGTANLAPMSSAWWLGQTSVLGLGRRWKTTENLRRERECVLNLVPSSLAGAVDRLALLTGQRHLWPRAVDRGYRYEPDKFAAAGLTPQRSELVGPPRVAECPIQLECTVVDMHPIDGPAAPASAIEVSVRRTHVDSELLIPGTAYVDPVRWDPLIMKFCEYFGRGYQVHPSRLAAGWSMPHATAAVVQTS